MSNIVDKYRSELLPAEELYRSLFLQAADAIVLIDASTGDLVNFNEKAYENLGYSKEEFSKLTIPDFEEIESDKEVTEHIAMITQNGSDVFETRHRTKAGEIRNILVSAKAICLNGKNYIHSIWRDITEQKKMESAIRLHKDIVENMIEGVFMIRASDGIIVYANPNLEKMFGYEKDEMLGKPVSIVNAPTDKSPEEVAATIQKELKEAGSWSGEVNNIKKDGTTFWCHANVTTFDHPQYGTVWVSVHEDITKRKVAQARLRESNAQLQSALSELKRTQQQVIHHERLSALGQMASGVAHDFNNVLMPIMGYTDLLISSPDTLDDRAEAISMLKTIRAAAEDAREVVCRLKQFYRPSGEAEGEPVCVCELIEQVVELTRPKWKEEMAAKGVTVKVTTEIQGKPFVSGNRPELEQVLTNLIFNAVEALPSGGTIAISAHTHKGGKGVEIQVADTGNGMTEEVYRRCLEPFFTTKYGHGAGLGLSLVHGIIRQHKGTVAVESALGEGTKITIHLPIGSPTAYPDSSAPSATPVTVEAMRILVIDDESGARGIVTRYLEADKHFVGTAENGKEGLQKFRGEDYDIVITDRAMPEMSGDEVASTIKNLNPEMPVIMLTGFGDMMKGETCSPPSVDLVVSKPVSGDELRQAIVTVIQNRRKS